jgi:hypothetical protein
MKLTTTSKEAGTAAGGWSFPFRIRPPLVVSCEYVEMRCCEPVAGGGGVKALTLHQPWASAIAEGLKTIETRSWLTSYRGPLAIHAAHKMPPMGLVGTVEVTATATGPWMWRLDSWRRNRDAGEQWGYALPLGAAVAVVNLVDVVPTAELSMSDQPGWRYEVLRSGTDHIETVFVGSDQRPWGNFTPGCFAWLLADVRKMSEPIPAKGRQGLWEWDESVAVA